MNTYRGLKCAMLVALFCLASTSFGAQVYWSSGVITLPNGSKAGGGDVTMYALVSLGITYGKIGGIDFYQVLNDGLTAEIAAKKYDAFFLSGQTDASGRVSVTDGMDSNSQYQNEVATVLFVCEYKGHEWYKQVYGEHNSTAAIPRYTNTNMALDGEWIMGREVSAAPEPSSALLSILGICVLALRRRFAT